jgi:hypothetical protein
MNDSSAKGATDTSLGQRPRKYGYVLSARAEGPPQALRGDRTGFQPLPLGFSSNPGPLALAGIEGAVGPTPHIEYN